jgi:hypothetical protein
MKKMIYLDSQEIERYQQTITSLRNDLDIVRRENNQSKTELKFLKENGDDILVIVKNSDNDVYEYRSTEKELMLKLVSENQSVREKYDEVVRVKDNSENQKQMLMLKYHEMNNDYKKKVEDLTKYINFLENRTFYQRISNSTKNKPESIEIEVINIETLPEQIQYSDNEIKKLQEESKSIRKERGWHFREEYIDSEGNVYHKGKIQPHLKQVK